MKLTSAQCNDFNFSSSLEWIETNGLGGYASGTVSGANTRKYHGLLVAATHPPVGRMIMVSKLEDVILAGQKRYELSANQYTGAVNPTGYTFLTGFKRDLFPEFTYRAGDFELRKTIVAVDGENTTLVLYEVLDAKKKFTLELLPLYAYRDFHANAHANNSIRHSYSFQNGMFQTTNYSDCPGICITVPGSEFVESQGWYYKFEYTEERSRGIEDTEDLYTHGRFNIELKKGSKLGVILSTEPPGEKDAFKIYQKEKKRREKIVDAFSWSSDLRKLSLAADQFIVRRGDLKTIIAGYHWFADWGRDTMISLPGLCLVTGRFDDAKNILKAFANSVSQGMLPNRFPDYNEPPEYNTIDATLWYFHAIYQYYKYAKDKTFIQTLLPVLTDIIDWHEKGTRYHIHADPLDGLIYGGEDGVQLTWMDAKVGDWVVTPRKGKPVEINALWYNALCIMNFFQIESGSSTGTFQKMATRVLDSFQNIFWNEERSFLYDVIDGDHKDGTIRPNAIYAVSLPFPLLTGYRAAKVLEIVKNELLTPKGLRSLNVSHPDYHPVYTGDQWHRDGAYHQGTVWSFLLGAYIDALIKVDPNGKEEAAGILTNFFPHFDEAGLCTVSEIFDGNSPHAPRGCIAQAWGVAEVFRVAIEHDLFHRPVISKNPL